MYKLAKKHLAAIIYCLNLHPLTSKKGSMAERLGSALQKRLLRFESGWNLRKRPSISVNTEIGGFLFAEMFTDSFTSFHRVIDVSCTV